MFAALKQKMEEKKARARAIAESKRWKNDALLQDCLQALRGSCTVVPVELHMAVETAVNIALREDAWTALEELIDIPEDFFEGMLYIVWGEAHLPVLKAQGRMVDEHLHDVRCVHPQTFLMAQTMDRIIWFDDLGQIKLYSIA